MAAQSGSAELPQVIVTVIVGAILALLASFGVYTAAQPSANSGKTATFEYGTGS